MKGTLWVFVEGPSDEQFFTSKIKPVLENQYQVVIVYSCRHKKDLKLDNHLKAIDATKSDYLFVTDYDEGPCVSGKKTYWMSRIPSLSPGRIVVVKREIESWYVSGLSDAERRRMRLTAIPPTTESFRKEDFEALAEGRYASPVELMQVLLDRFDMSEARNRNQSFDHFVITHLMDS